MQNFAPVALFVYNRPDHTRRTLSYLQKNLLAVDSRLYIFSDAAKTPADEAKVAEVRQIIAMVSGFKSIRIIERPYNMGLANSIIDGVSRLTKDYGRVIVFEDDLLSSPYTLQYFNEALDRYENNDLVMHIGAYMYSLKNDALPQTFFFRAATSWGWATWARAWDYFQPDADVLLGGFDAEKTKRFSIEGSMNFWKQLLDFKAGKNNSWAIRWYASIFLRTGLTLNPSHSLIQNIGNDGSGVHSNNEQMYQVHVACEPITEFPALVKEDETAYNSIKNFLRHRKGSLWERLVRFVKQRFK